MNPPLETPVASHQPARKFSFGWLALLAGNIQFFLIGIIVFLLMTYYSTGWLSELILRLVSPQGVALGPSWAIAIAATITGGMDLYRKDRKYSMFMTIALLTLVLAPLLIETIIYQTDYTPLLDSAARSAPGFLQEPLLNLLGIAPRLLLGMTLIWLVVTILIMLAWQSLGSKPRRSYLGIALAQSGYLLFSLFIAILHHP